MKFERLEFLGDRILGLVIAEYVFKNFKKDDEGSLSKMHASFVCANACHKIALKIGLDESIQTAGIHLKQNKTVLSDAMEAILGAVFIDGGFDVVKNIVLDLWKDLFENFDKSLQEPKTHLQELLQAKTGEMPIYELISTSGPDHLRSFVVSAKGFGKSARGEGLSRKLAESLAAKNLLKIILPLI